MVEVTEDAADLAKRERYRLRARAWDAHPATWSRLKKCGACPVGEGGSVGLRLGTAGGRAVAGFAGLATCGSVWACPVCMAKIATKRADELAQTLDWATEQGHTVGMVTFTIRHHKGDALAALTDAAMAAWAAVTSGQAWHGESEDRYAERLAKWERKDAARTAELGRRAAGYPASMRLPRLGKRPVRKVGMAERWGVLGWARVLEVTHGEHGWHPHIHAVIVLEGDQTEDCMRRLAEAMWPAWEAAVRRRGFDAWRDSGGLDVRCSSAEAAAGIAAYFTKQLALEATSGYAKKGRGKGSRTPLQILTDLTTTGDADDLDLWHEWVRATDSRRQIGWSRDFRALAGLADEQTDEEIAAEEVGDGDDVILMDGDTWEAVAYDAGDLLVIAERGGEAAAIAWLDARRLPWTRGPAPYHRPRE